MTPEDQDDVRRLIRFLERNGLYPDVLREARYVLRMSLRAEPRVHTKTASTAPCRPG